MDLSRRELLRASAGTAGVATASATAGCLDAVPFVGGSDNPLSPVPAGADGVVRVDAGTALADEALRSVGDVAFGDRGVRRAVDSVLDIGLVDGPTSTAEWESLVRSTYDLDPRAASTVTVFVVAAPENPDRTAVGAVIEADWSPSTVVDGLGTAGLSVSEREVGEVTIYDVENTPASLGVIEDGRYVAGVFGAVPLAASVVNGDADPIGDPVKSAFTNSGSGPVRFGARAAPIVEVVVSLIPGDVSLIREQLFAEIETVSGSVGIDGDERVLRMRAHADSPSTAKDLQNTIEGAMVIVGARSSSPAVKTATESLQTTVDGDVLTLTYRTSVADLTALARVIAGSIGGGG